MNRAVGIEAAKVLLFETNSSLNKLDTAKSPVSNLFSFSLNMKLPFCFSLPVNRFTLLKKRFGEFKNRVSRSSKFFSFPRPQEFADKISHFRFSIFFEGVRYCSYLLSAFNVKLCRIMLFFTSLSNQVLFDFASFKFSLKTLTAVVSASARLSVNLSKSCSKFDNGSSILILSWLKFHWCIIIFEKHKVLQRMIQPTTFRSTRLGMV